MDLSISPLFSGSKGNSIYIAGGKTGILIDAGYSCAKIGEELKKADGELSKIKGILITHEHSDHIAGAGAISRKFDVPIYANSLTWSAMEKRLGKIAQKNIRVIDEAVFYIDDLCIEPYATSHDAACPFGYAVSCGIKKIAVMTDLGKVTNKVLKAAAGASIVLLESNHDIEMLKSGPYPYSLKERILSSRGHLSNDAAAKTALKLAKANVKGILLGHLSETNNFYELAITTVNAYLKENGIYPGKHIGIGLAKREGLTGVYKVPVLRK